MPQYEPEKMVKLVSELRTSVDRLRKLSKSFRVDSMILRGSQTPFRHFQAGNKIKTHEIPHTYAESAFLRALQEGANTITIG